ncbi:MAG: hypothetical protein IJV99_02980, partial [Clostridia bacterium]|nr:hypothetical protein [Clostridia bacterium]
SENYNANKQGRYTFEFITSNIPAGIQDGYSLLKVYVGVGLEDPVKPPVLDSSNSNSQSDQTSVGGGKDGCNSSFGVVLAGASAVILAGLGIFIYKKKPAKK